MNPGDAPAVRALVVDDNRDAAEMMALLLGLEGHDVATAYDGASSIVKVLSFKPNLVLLDIGMPNLDGYDVARRIQTFSLSPRPFLVAVTGYATLDDTRRSAEAGFDLHVRKPLLPDVFQGVVELLRLSSSGVHQARESSEASRHAVTRLVLRQLEMANFYLDAAHATMISESRDRWIAKAMNAHDRVARWLDTDQCDEERSEDVVEALNDLRRRLPS